MDDLAALSASALAAAIARRDVAPSEVMAACLDRIARINPALNAVVGLRDGDALMAEARAADDAPRRGWLHGIPLAVKDLQAVAGIRSTAGSPLFADHLPIADEMLARRLRAAGAILIGKTNVPEFGLGSHSFNPVYGVTANPYAPDRTAGGSSGGAAAALAARLVPVADGSDMMGSLRNPAAFCNVYGFRPSFGRVPADPVGDTFLHMLATDGPMGRTIEDIARLLETLAAPAATSPHAMPPEPFAAALDADPAGLRIGWLGDWGGAWPMEPGILDLCEAALASFAAMGCHVEPVAPPIPAAPIWDAWCTLRSWVIAARLGPLHAAPETRARLKPEALWEIERGLALDAMAVHRASVVRSAWFTAAAALFARFDALAMPAAQVWPFPKAWHWPEKIGAAPMDTYHRWMECVVPVSLIGLPALAVPVGFGGTDGTLPMGMQLAGPRGADRAILRLGQAWHRATDWPGRRPPPV
ncbi:MAG: amidase [Gemmobacter sp.]